ncbi:MAG: GAF domain-containing protein [Candidatus Eisenbacteria bacterium]|uniref:GAF domain-containing protein n=1 Tax=Eiseniibacteriota bacterium TaxID=2212470 RepID=A0A538T5Y8_UNCEI|nr:MAG: GAF domain-containing protein [Candidatus Eisenbacteria bacterium]
MRVRTAKPAGRTTGVEPWGAERMNNADRVIADLEARHRLGVPFEDLLHAAVRGLHDLDERFHWTGIYELFPDNVLRLGPFVGAPTDHVFIGVGRGVCGTAVAERRNINVPDVRLVSNYLACSTETRSELVILIRSGEKIYAQIDIDSHQVAAFDEGAVMQVQRVADWLASLYHSRERLGRAP